MQDANHDLLPNQSSSAIRANSQLSNISTSMKNIKQASPRQTIGTKLRYQSSKRASITIGKNSTKNLYPANVYKHASGGRPQTALNKF